MDFDVVVAGAGQVGTALASALRQADPHAAIALIDPNPPAARSDGRASAIAAASRRLLDRLGVWAEIASEAQPIDEMVITDSRLDDAVRPVFLGFDGVLGDGTPFAHMVANDALSRALCARAEAAGVRLITPERIDSFDVGPATVSLRLASGGRLETGLLIAADGAGSRLRALAGIGVLRRDYDRVGIVATIAHERPHGGCAEEHFLPAGPFARLPLVDDAAGRHRSSLVWTEHRGVAERILADDSAFRIELERRLGLRLGALEPLDRPRAHPLALGLADDFVRPRFALAGDAAHAIHPIAGQGLNLGLRDVAALAEVVIEARRLGLDPGGIEVLEAYRRRRRFDAVEMGVVTDLLARLFSGDLGPVRAIRDLGLGLVDRSAGLKRRLIRDAAGIGGAVPRLLRGEPI